MKRYILSFWIAITTVYSGISQVPQQFNYQAILRDGSGEIQANSNVEIIVKLLQGTIDGTEVFTETHSETTNDFGLINLRIGSVNTSGFATINWLSGPYFLNISVNGTDLGTTQLLSNPFALVAQDVVNNEDNDPDPSNELQLISISNDTVSLSNGGQIKLPTERYIQELTVSEFGDTLYISESNFIIVPGISVPNYNRRNVTVTDYDGNVYKTVMIGNQIWMAENLKTTKYNNGTAIPLVTDNTEWGMLTTPAYCWYNNDSVTYAQTYGALYNWYTVNTGNLCPTGWHVSTDAEWTTLTTYLGGENVAGVKLKETGTTHWSSPNTGATNETGFTALPGGKRDVLIFSYVGETGYWWSSTEYAPLYAWYWYINYSSSYVYRNNLNKQDGLSVRCVRVSK